MRIHSARRTAFLPLAALALGLAACGGGGGGKDAGPGAPVISGTVTAPGGQAATSAAGWLRRAGEALGVVTPRALTVLPPAAGLPVALVALDDLGDFVSTVASTTTDANGFYALPRPAAFTPGLTYAVVAGGAANGLRAFATGTTVDVNPFTHVAWTLVVQQIRDNPGTALSDIPADQVVGLVETAQDLGPSVDLSATTAQVIAALTTAVQTAEDTGGLLANLLEPGGFAGTVTGPGGAPLADVQVKVFRHPEWTLEARLRTDASGRYTAHLPAGQYIVAAVNDGAASLAASGWWTSGGGAALQNAAEATTVANALIRRDFALGAGGRVSGTVTAEATGAPLAGVRVVLKQFDLGFTAIPVRTGADGRFTINALPGAYYLEIYNDTLQPYASELYSAAAPYPNGANNRLAAQKLTVVAGASTPANASLLAGQRLFGTVVDPVAATSVAGAVVRITDQATGSATSFARTTDRNGTFALWLRPEPYVVRARGQTANVNLSSSAQRVDFAAPVGTITATLRHPGGAPAVGVFGHLHDAANLASGLFAWEAARADGSLSLFVPTSVTSVVVQFRSDELPGATIVHPGQSRLYAGQRLLAPAAGNTLPLGTVTLPAGGLLTGTVRKAGVAKGANWVTIRSGGTVWSDVVITVGTLSDGSYRIALPAGTYSRVCTLEPPGTTICDGAQQTGATWAYQDGVTVTAGATTTLDLSYPGHSIAGAVSGAVTSGVTLTLSGAAGRATTSGPGGAYVFANLANGSYTVTPSLAGYTFSPASRSVTVSGGSVAAQDFTATHVPVPPGLHAISGNVSGVFTSAVPVMITAGTSTTPAKATTDTQGAYSLGGIPDGTYTITPFAPGYTFSPRSITVTVSGADSTGNDFVSAVDTNPHAIRGTVSGAASVSVTLDGPAGPMETTTTDGQGAYSFTGLPDGAYTVTPSLIGHAFTPPLEQVTISGGDVAGVDFEASGVQPPSAPPAPAAVAAFPGDGGALVAWTPSAGATSYRVYAGTTLPLTQASPVASTSGYTAVVGGRANGQRVYFAVSAVGPGGESALAAPRCVVPTASTAATSGSPLELYDPLCDDWLAGSRWLNNGAYAVEVLNGQLSLAADGSDLEPRALRNGMAIGTASVRAGNGVRVTTLAADLSVAAADVFRTGQAVLRGAIRLTYQPPANRLSAPYSNLDNITFEVGLAEAGAGLYAYRNVIHCDDATCGVTSTANLDFSGDPANLTTIPGTPWKGAPAAYDTTYRAAVRLDESTGLFHWSITGGALGPAGLSGTVDPSLYVSTTASYATAPLSGAAFGSAQLTARVHDASGAGGGSGWIDARFDNVHVGTNGGPAAPYDDFSVAPALGPSGQLSLVRWNVGTAVVQPDGGNVAISNGATSAGGALTQYVGLNLARPEQFDMFQADVAVPIFATTGTAGQAAAYLQGRFHNDGTAGRLGDATGDIVAGLALTAGGGAGGYVNRCSDATCSTGTNLGAITLPGSTGTGSHMVRLGYSRALSAFEFAVDGVATTLAAPPGAAYVTAARAPLKQVFTRVGVPAQVGSGGIVLARVNNVSGRPDSAQGIGLHCNAMDPASAPSVAIQYIPQAAPSASAAGGAILDGTYRLTALNVYTGVGGAPRPAMTARQTFVFAGGALDYAGLVGGGSEKRHGQWAAAGADLVIIATCPTIALMTFRYTASGTTLTLHDGTDELVLVRQ